MQQAAAIIVIGNEILTGKVVDENSPFLVKELRSLGTAVELIQVIPDEVPVIAEMVQKASQNFEHVITTGGVGPTLDDVTFEGVAKAFNLRMVTEQKLVDVIHAHLKDKVTPAHLRMARVPEGTDLIWPEGAPWPVTRVRNVLVLPGSPELVVRKWAGVRHHYQGQPWHLRRLYTSLDEGSIAQPLDDLQLQYPQLEIGSYPAWENPEFEVKVTLESRDAAEAQSALQTLVEALPEGSIVRVD